MAEKCGESEKEVMGEGKDESEKEELVRSERSVISREDDDGGRARVTTDEERVLRER